jgi:hypothetical protein
VVTSTHKNLFTNKVTITRHVCALYALTEVVVAAESAEALATEPLGRHAAGSLRADVLLGVEWSEDRKEGDK